MDELTNLMARNGFLPHGYCFQWSPGLLWTMVGSDVAIALAYFSIPLVIVSYVRQRPQVNLGGLASLFGAFIFACGITHVLDVWTIWRPDYPLHAAAKLATAVVSVFTAVTAWRLLPQALAIPSVDELRSAVAALKTEADRRHSVEDRLLEIEQSLAVTLATIDAAFITTDAKGHVTRINEVAERITGWSAAEATGRSVWEVFNRAGRSPEMLLRNPVDVLVDSGWSASTRQALVCIRRDGRHVPVELHADLTRLEDGQVRGMTIIFRDVERLTSAEAEVRRLAAVVESSSDAIVVQTLDGRITDWNAAAERMFGHAAADAVGRQMQILLPPECEAEELRVLAGLARGETLPPFRTVRLTKDGRRLEVSVQVSPIRDAHGRIVGGANAARDLTHQRQIETALRQSEARLRFALESAGIGDWELDARSERLQRSRRFDLCFGHAESPLHWSRTQMLACVHDEDRAAVAQSLDTALDSARPWHAEFRVLWPDGSRHWLRMDARPAHDGGVLRLVGIVADVGDARLADEAREQAQQLEAENRRMQESSRLKSQFLANMSHELRTPLNAVIGFADLLRNDIAAPGPEKRGEYLGHIASSGRHLLRVINDVLDLSKIEAGKLDFQPAPLDLPALVDEVIGNVGTQAAARRLEITTSLADELQTLHLDGSRLRQVLYNYLSNAIKFTEPGGRIAVRALAEGPQLWRLEVEDSGAGIAAADLPRLFVEFQQLDGGYAKRHQGTGLGLALTRRLVEAQGGRVGVYSTPGQGSRFYAVLPRQAGSTLVDDGAPRLLVAANDHPLRDALARQLAT
ncbi:MAG: PAS domain S-box protein, partial [Rubrivivax sp.]